MATRRELLVALGASTLSAPFASLAQQQGKVWRIGVLETTSMQSNAVNVDAFKKGLREEGYVEGKNLVIEYRSVDGHAERFPDLATELVRLNVDLILIRGTPAALSAKAATGTIPVVMVAVADPIGAGVIASYARPGGNVTGLSSMVAELAAKRLQLARELVPRLARIAGLFNMSDPADQLQWKQLDILARSLGVQSQLLDVQKPDDFQSAFEAAVKQRAEALVTSIDGLMQANARSIIEFAAKYRLPAIYPYGQFVSVGGLISYGVSYTDLYYRSATFVHKIFRGVKPADLPVEQPTKFEMVVNMKTAKALGIKIPNSILVQATKVIE